jgi:hypothetical protein
LSIFSAVLFAIACFLTSGSASLPEQGPHVPKHGATVPQWPVDLRSTVGGVPLGVVVGRGHEIQLSPQISLWFLDNNTVVATFVVREGEGKPQLSLPDGLDKASPIRLRAIFLDAATGKITAAPDWPSESRYAGIVAVHDGQFVTQRGTDLTLYSSDLRELKRLKLPQVEEIGWAADSSLTGRSIVFVPAGATKTVVPWIWIDTDTLQIAHSWQDVHSGWLSITDEKIARVACGWVYNCEPRIDVRGIATDWKTVASVDRGNKPRPQFVNNDMLFLSGNLGA